MGRGGGDPGVVSPLFQPKFSWTLGTRHATCGFMRVRTSVSLSVPPELWSRVKTDADRDARAVSRWCQLAFERELEQRARERLASAGVKRDE